MTRLVASHRHSEQGFTLVELAIVMVIIGLLIGGILKGQELITTARVGATVSQLKSLDGAINTFQEKYAAYPGDMLRPDTRLPGCTTSPCNVAGDGNSIIQNGASRTGASLGGGPGTVTNASQGEGHRAFTHLTAADLLTGIDPSNPGQFSGTLPAIRAGGGMWIGYSDTATATGGVTTLTPGRHYAVLNGIPGAVAATSGGFNSITAAQIDRKMDDGRPDFGGVQTIGTGCSITVAGVVSYAEAVPGGACAMYARIMN